MPRAMSRAIKSFRRTSSTIPFVLKSREGGSVNMHRETHVNHRRNAHMNMGTGVHEIGQWLRRVSR